MVIVGRSLVPAKVDRMGATYPPRPRPWYVRVLTPVLGVVIRLVLFIKWRGRA